jgi:5-methyltetrahydrofolate corrinoid/iron sulfur protein methyltransferase
MHVIIVGELINSTRAGIKKAIEGRDAPFIEELARKQAEAGAAWIDANAGAFQEGEGERLVWLIESIRGAGDFRISIDSPRPEVVEMGLERAGSGALVNSISAEKERYRSLVPLIMKYGAGVIALSLDDSGIRDDYDGALVVADGLIQRLEDDGIPPGHIFADPLVRPASVDTSYPSLALTLIEGIFSRHPEVHLICGLSNVSYGLPRRRLLNRTFLAMAIDRGLDSAILDPLDRRLMAELLAAECLMDKDPFCAGYIGAEREGKL